MNLVRKSLRLMELQQPFALAIVIRATGSTPQKAGAQAVFEPDGTIHGTLGGGCLEAECRRRALDALDVGTPLLFDLSLNDDFGWDDGLICGGNVRVLIEPRPERHRQAMLAAHEAAAAGLRGVLLWQMPPLSPAQVRWIPESEIESFCPFPGSSSLCGSLQSDTPTYCIEESADGQRVAEIFVEPVSPQPTLLIAGGGHVGQAVARFAAALQFQVTVIDDRVAFTNASLYPSGVTTLCDNIPKAVAAFPKHAATYILVVTRGHRHDGVVLKECIHAPVAFIGMIGSKRKAHIIRDGFLREGVATREDFERVQCPVGLDIGALTVEEIAISIVSQLVAVRRNRTGAGQPLSVYTAP